MGILILAIGLPFSFMILNGQGIWGSLLQMFPPFLIVGSMMWMKHGNPLNWWYPYFGTMAFVSLSRISIREQSGEHSDEIQREIEAWVHNCAKGRWYKVNPFAYKFIRKGDAMMFKLAWG